MDKTVLVFFMLSGDDLSNIDTLKDIFQQTYQNIILIVIDNCCEGCLNERIFSEFEKEPHDGVRQIIFIEEKNPKAEDICRYNVLKTIHGDYMITMYAGDRFSDCDALEKAVEVFEENPESSALITGADKTDDTISEHYAERNSGLTLFKVENWIEYFEASAGAGDCILHGMHSDGKLCRAEEAICIPGRNNHFHKPDNKSVIASADGFYKSKEEFIKEKNEIRKNKAKAYLHGIMGTKMFISYVIAFLVLFAGYALLRELSFGVKLVGTLKIASVISGAFAFAIFLLKICRRLRRKRRKQE